MGLTSLLQCGAQVKRLTIDGTNYILAAGTSDVNSTVVDMQGFDSVLFILAAGVIATSGAVSIKVQEGAASNLSDAADLANTNIGPCADTDDNKLFISEILRPAKRYLRVVTTRGDGGNSTIDFLIAILFNAGKMPVAADALVFGQETWPGPAEGTA